jgi:hypothetical protein
VSPYSIISSYSLTVSLNPLVVRQEIIRHEKKEQSAIRWLRIIVRSLPMSFFILGLPAVLVHEVFAKDTTYKRRITLSLVCYLSGVIGLQILFGSSILFLEDSRCGGAQGPFDVLRRGDPAVKRRYQGILGLLLLLETQRRGPSGKCNQS